MESDDFVKPRKNLPKTAVPRIFFIDHEIGSGRYPNAPSMAKKYETSLSSINRDIAYMRDMLGAPIEYDFFKKGFYYSEPSFRLSAAYATADDILALGMAKNLLDLYKNTPIHEAALNLLESISAPLQDEKNTSWFKDRIVIPKTAAAPVDKDAWNIIVSALRGNKTIAFQYAAADEKTVKQKNPLKERLTARRVRPYQLLFDKSSWYLFGFDEDRNTMRIFAVSRITGASLTADTFTVPRDFDYRAQEGASYFGIFAGVKTYKFMVAISGDTRWIKERVWAADQVIKNTKTGIVLSFTSNQFDKVLDWILSQGPRARPLAPKQLVEQWEQNIREMAKLISI